MALPSLKEAQEVQRPDVAPRSPELAALLARAKASGSLAKHAVELSAKGEGLDLQTRLRGAWRGEAGWSGEVQTLRNSGPYPLELKAPFSVQASKARVELGRVDAIFAGGQVTIAQLLWSGEKVVEQGSSTRGAPAVRVAKRTVPALPSAAIRTSQASRTSLPQGSARSRRKAL